LLYCTMKYRIAEKYDTASGEVKFFPEFRKFGFWFPFMTAVVFPTVIKYDSYESADRFLAKQINKPNPKYHYLKY
jgi:hypothetical protein